MSNHRIYPKEVFMKHVNDYEKKMQIVLYCEDCLQPWEKGVTNLDSLDQPCCHCGSFEAPGITQKRMRELKIKKLIE